MQCKLTGDGREMGWMWFPPPTSDSVKVWKSHLGSYLSISVDIHKSVKFCSTNTQQSIDELFGWDSPAPHFSSGKGAEKKQRAEEEDFSPSTVVCALHSHADWGGWHVLEVGLPSGKRERLIGAGAANSAWLPELPASLKDSMGPRASHNSRGYGCCKNQPLLTVCWRISPSPKLFLELWTPNSTWVPNAEMEDTHRIPVWNILPAKDLF